jgi:hypothetical protein
MIRVVVAPSRLQFTVTVQVTLAKQSAERLTLRHA